MSCQPSLSKSATQTPGPNSSRLIEIPLSPLKCLNWMRAAAVTFVNWIGANRPFWGVTCEAENEQTPVSENISIRTKSATNGRGRRLEPLLEDWDMVQWVDLISSAPFYMYVG